jgi:hypothetical protein
VSSGVEIGQTTNTIVEIDNELANVIEVTGPSNAAVEVAATPSAVVEVASVQHAAIEVNEATATVIEVAAIWVNAGGIDDLALQTHVQAPLPHPAYDDIPSLKLLFENGLA